MSTTRQAYRPSYRPDGAPIERESECTCGQTFPNLGELFGHDCPDDPRFNGASRSVPNVATSAADSLDVPEWRGGAAGHSPRRSAPKANRFAGECVACHANVAAGAGEIRKDAADKWIVVCGRCAPSIDRTPAAAPQPAEAPKSDCRPNRYAGQCRHCGTEVAASAGLLCKIDGRWAVEHAAGECVAAHGHTAPSPAATADVAAGHYAIPSTGDNDLAFYRVDRPTEGDYAGRTFVKLIVGGHPDRNVRRDAVAGILERIAADPDAAARYGQELGRCSACNRKLTDETSRALGIGPECRTK